MSTLSVPNLQRASPPVFIYLAFFLSHSQVVCVPEPREAMEAALEETSRLSRELKGLQVMRQNDLRRLETGGVGATDKAKSVLARAYMKAMCLRLYTCLLSYEDDSGRPLAGVFYKVRWIVSS